MLSLPLHLGSCQQFRLSVLEPRDRAYHRSHTGALTAFSWKEGYVMTDTHCHLSLRHVV